MHVHWTICMVTQHGVQKECRQAHLVDSEGGINASSIDLLALLV